MKTPEEIKRGLETCTMDGCDGCPYNVGDLLACFEVHADALAYIRELEARVEELDKRCDAEALNATTAIRELEETKLHCLEQIKVFAYKLAEYEKPLKPMTWEEAMMDDFFLEIRGDDCIDGALNDFAVDGDEGYMWINTRNRAEDESKLMRSDYGKTWRAWSRRPTDEERKAAKWDE